MASNKEISSLQAIVLAAGTSSRFKTGRSKLIEKICGREMVLYPTEVLKNLNIPVLMVVGFQKDIIEETIRNNFHNGVSFVHQEEQKGTGNARAGITSSPLWISGGRAFPNRPDENYSKKVNKKAYRAGMKSIFSELVRQDRLTVVEDFKVDKPKTKSFNELIKHFNIEKNVLVITDEFDENLYLSSRNIPTALVV